MNSVNLMGNMTRDPRDIPSGGKKMVGFTLAVPREYNTELVDYIDVVAFGNVGEAVLKYTRKGSKVCVTGSVESYKPEGEKFGKLNIVASRVEFISTPQGEKSPASGGLGKLEPIDEDSLDDDDDCPF